MVSPASGSFLDLAGYASDCERRGRIPEAARAYRAALEVNAESPAAWNNLGSTLLALGDTAGAVAAFGNAHRILPSDRVILNNLRFAVRTLPEVEAAKLLRSLSAPPQARAGPSPAPPPPLRIGYISPGFGAHAIPLFFKNVLRAHDRERVELYCYSTGGQRDQFAGELRRLSPNWFDLYGLSDTDAAELIRSHHLHALIDRGGYCPRNRVDLMAYRLAPVQATSADFPATLGTSAIPYRLTDAALNPEQSSQAFTERHIYLPTALCYSPPRRRPRVGPLPARGKGYVTFAAFHRLSKFSPDTIGAFAAVLHKTPESRLVIHHSFGSTARVSAGWRGQVMAQFAAHGVSASRVRWFGTLPHYESMALYREADLALDSYPSCGVTTTAEALLMGVAVVTRYGDQTRTRYGLSLLNSVGLPELAAPSQSEFVGKAVEWASDWQRLESLRKQLRRRVLESPLCDARSHARAIEEACLRLLTEQTVRDSASPPLSTA